MLAAVPRLLTTIFPRNSERQQKEKFCGGLESLQILSAALAEKWKGSLLFGLNNATGGYSPFFTFSFVVQPSFHTSTFFAIPSLNTPPHTHTLTVLCRGTAFLFHFACPSLISMKQPPTGVGKFRKSTTPTNQPRTTKYEWGGPIGSAGMVLFLPLIVIGLNVLCNDSTCSLPASVPQVVEHLQNTLMDALLLLPEALGLELLWLAAHSIFYLLPIGRVVPGTQLRDGKVLQYRLNAIHAFVLSHVLIFGCHFAGIIDLTYLCEMFSALMMAAILISTIMSIVLYCASYRSDRVLTALGGNSGNLFYDFWMGRELNPRTGFLDWKFMCELRPGLIGWSILNWAFVFNSYRLGTLTPSICLISFFHSLYVVDGLLLEVGNLTMMDITTDGFGFMLCFGDLAWVPFTYTLQTKYLCYHPVYLNMLYLVCCTTLVVVGYTVFRGANSEKDRFRSNPQDPRVAHLKTMKTSKGKSLIISGYWGACRHPNYIGDWMMALGWATFTGWSAVLPYFHPIYFGTLLMHRQLRDEEMMQEKYGPEDWKKFCSIVKYRLIPHVY
eukprot:gene1557-941_t